MHYLFVDALGAVLKRHELSVERKCDIRLQNIPS